MDSGITIGHVAGIEVRVNLSVLVVFALIAWSLAEGALPDVAEGYAATTYWLAAVGLTIAFFAGLLAHELGHSLVGRREGVTVKRITLWLFGGIAQLDNRPTTPRSALRIAVAGPAVSAGIGVLSIAAAVFTSGLLGAALAWYGAINLLLAGFNLIPAYPMDGGRIHQAWLWRRTGDETDATRRSAALGRTIGAVMIGLGIAEVLLTGMLGGIWLALIGWFVREAATIEEQQVRVALPLAAVPVTDVMSRDPVRVPADVPVDRFVSDLILAGRHAAYPVIDHDGRVRGLVTLRAVRLLPRDRWATTPVAAIATPLGQVTVVAPSASVADLIGRLRADGDTRTLVMDGERLVGIVSPSDITRLVAAVELAGSRPPLAV